MIRSSRLPACVLACAALPAFALATEKAAPKAKAPYPTGPGSLAGMWQSPYPPDQLRQPGDPAPPVEVGPSPLKEPWKSEIAAQRKAAADALAAGKPQVNNGVRCIPGGFPGMMGPVFPLEVLETPQQINITNEAYNQTRRIYMNEKQVAVDDAEPVFFGHSVGRWEKGVLVVNTIGMKDQVRMSGVPHSPNMRVDERMRRTGPETMEDQITITDPEYLTGPWTFTYHYKKMTGYKLGEFICENNRDYDPKTDSQKLDLSH
ncbi:MAG: hypothetical protein ACXU8Z_06275 [Caulobacteraceae bacterium]